MTPGTQAMSQDSKITLEVQPPRNGGGTFDGWCKYVHNPTVANLKEQFLMPTCQTLNEYEYDSMAKSEPMMNLLHMLTIHSPQFS